MQAMHMHHIRILMQKFEPRSDMKYSNLTLKVLHLNYWKIGKLLNL